MKSQFKNDAVGSFRRVHLVVVCLALLVVSCVPTVLQKTVNRHVPTAFRNATDTVNSAAMNWREYYRDPNLVTLIDSALARNQELNIVMQEIDIAQNEVLARSGEYLPFVNLRAGGGVDKSASFTRNGAIEEGLEIKPGERFPKPLPDVGLSATVQWEVDIWNRLRNATKSAGLRYLASTEGARYVVTNLVSEIAGSYYELLALDNLLEAVNSNISILKNALTIVEQQKIAARTTELAVRRFEAEVLKNESHRYEIQQRITETENRINFLVGRYPQRLERTSSGFFAINLDSVKTGVPSQLLLNRPDVRQSEQELKAAELDIDVARARFYPSLSILGGIGYQAFNPQFLFTTPESMMYNLAGELLTPVVNRRGITAALNTSNAKQIQAAYNYERTLLTSYIEVANRIAKVSNLQNSLSLKTRQVAALTESVDIAGTLFTSARADYMEVLLTQRDALEAKMELIDTKVEQLKASIELYRALGGGWR
ncbi:MAG: TolC family protein [Candidatus Kapabacteria bacterium]|nr:TolC family protein [Candidatus Kapabacteria bacterium]